MYHQTRTARIRARCLLVTTVITVVITGCTREPYDADRKAELNEGAFTFQVVIDSESIIKVTSASASDGRMGAAVTSTGWEINVIEESAGAWSEIGTLSGDGLRTTTVDISPANGSWWVLASHLSEGLRLFRVGGGMDASYTIPNYGFTEWDSISAALATNNAGEPVIMLRARNEGLFQATMADTGWALVALSGSNSNSKVLDYMITGTDDEYLLYRPLLTGTASVKYSALDTVRTDPIARTTEFLSLAPASDAVHILGPLSDVDILVLWNIEIGLDVPESIPVHEAFLGHSSVAFTSDDRPYVICGKYRSSDRFDLVLSTRSPDLYNINWDADAILLDAPILGVQNRMHGFTVVVDAFDVPHILFLSGNAGSSLSTLYEAVPKS
ncbi:hypothetical protein ACFL3H_02605 [Gemmatimonadota bacterium]